MLHSRSLPASRIKTVRNEFEEVEEEEPGEGISSVIGSLGDGIEHDCSVSGEK